MEKMQNMIYKVELPLKGTPVQFGESNLVLTEYEDLSYIRFSVINLAYKPALRQMLKVFPRGCN